MDWLQTLGLAAGSAWMSGFRLYALVATLGLLARFKLVQLPGQLGYLSNWWVIGVASALFAVEFFADKIPAVDSAWDMIHTFIRVPAGALLASAAFADSDPVVRGIALLLGGGIALSAHGTKAATRMTANMSPEPFSNILLSLTEDGVGMGAVYMMAFHPLVMLVIVGLFVALAVWLIPKIVRAIRRLFTRKPEVGAAAGA